MQLSPLRVSNEDFLVSSMIERCPKSMMLRELVKNALESAANATDAPKLVEISPVLVADPALPADNPPVQKLCIWNTGPGMNAEELFRMCDIASSIGKSNSLDENFGMGAKVASLPSNPHGIRYRSCAGGRVHQVVMGKRDGRYGRLRQVGPDGIEAHVLDVTPEAAADGRPLHHDWTEVLLLGMRAEQNTLLAPYDGDPAMPPEWIAAELYWRFFSTPHDIALILKDGANVRGGDRLFGTLSRRIADFVRYEAVPVGHGITIHYYFDANDEHHPGELMTSLAALQQARSAAGLVYRGEIYDLRAGVTWLHEAAQYGIPFGARNFSVFVELPDDFPLTPDGYRQFLRHAGHTQRDIELREFSALVRLNRPIWLQDLMQEFAPDSSHTKPLHAEMASLFRVLGIRRRVPRVLDALAGIVPTAEPATDAPAAEGGVPEPWQPVEEEFEYEVVPQIIPLRIEDDVWRHGLLGKAARFYPDTHELFVNADYKGFAGFREVLEREFSYAGDPERVRHAALTVGEQFLIRQICRRVAFGLSKRDEWLDWEVEHVTSMASLTMAVDDQAPMLPDARAEMTRLLGPPPPEPSPTPDEPVPEEPVPEEPAPDAA